MAGPISKGFLRRRHRTVSTLQKPFYRLLVSRCKLFSKTNGHHLDKPHMERILLCQDRHLQKILLALKSRNTVYLHLKLRIGKCCLKSFQHLFQLIPSGDFSKSLCIQSV